MANDWDQEIEEQATSATDEVSGADVEEEQSIDQQIVPFMGDDLAAAMTAEGTIYITFPGMCTALGLNVRGQTQRVQRTRTLRQALRRIPLETRGGLQRINCLRVDKLALWLAGVQTNQIKPRFREKIEAYQEELAPLAMQVFMRVVGVQPSTTTAPAVTAAQITEIAEQLDTLTGVVTFLREHLDAGLAATSEQIGALSMRLEDALRLLEALGERQVATESQIARIDERTQRLTPAPARAIQEMVDGLARETKRLATPLTYAMIYGRLKHRFRASSYREIADEQYEAVMAHLRDELRRALAGESPEQGSLF